MKIGYTAGVFDMFHIGHLNLLRRAKEMCDYLIVGVTTDELCESRKKKKPIIPYEERIEIVRQIKYVDQVVPQTSMDKLAAFERYKFQIIFVGDDWKGSPEWNALEQAHVMDIVYLSYTQHTSSTKLRATIEKILQEESQVIVINERMKK